MKLEQSFDVAAPLDVVWRALNDLERVAPCLPGATITGHDDDGTYHGEFKVKLGPTTAAYRGTIKITDSDESTHTATLAAKGADKRGQGGATATIVNRVADEDGVTRVHALTDFTITGRLARFGRGGMIQDISNKLLENFAACLATRLADGPDGADGHGRRGGAGGGGPAQRCGRGSGDGRRGRRGRRAARGRGGASGRRRRRCGDGRRGRRGPRGARGRGLTRRAERRPGAERVVGRRHAAPGAADGRAAPGRLGGARQYPARERAAQGRRPVLVGPVAADQAALRRWQAIAATPGCAAATCRRSSARCSPAPG